MLSMDAHNDHVASAVRSWKPPAWLLAVGPVGTGKTSWLTSLFIEQLFTESSFSQSLWTTEASLFERADIAHEHHGYTPMLMIDDLGASRRRLTEWQGSAMRNLFDVRYSNGLPVFITTNLSVKDLINRYGDHIHSRIMSASGGALFVPGRDRRINGSQTDI
jgi:DNA replication protein DnaC